MENKICGIYKITNPKGRIYVGQSIDIKSRWQHHRKNRNKKTVKLYRSFNKYGVENHKFEIICECEFDELNKMERYYQEFFNTLHEGLNCIYVDDGVKKMVMSEETKRKIGLKHKGKKMSDEQRAFIKHLFSLKEYKERISLGRLKRIGIKQTEEHIKKRVSYHLGAKRSDQAKNNMRNAMRKYYKKVYQYSLDLKLINTYESLTEMKRKNGFDISSVSRVCHKKQKTSYGFIWSFELLDAACYLKRLMVENNND